ncbi:MAG: CoB--CoM heterodisulfide reductase iron-sulfur subunit A family protein, partial [Bacteroidales bacterium]|nr:CoB--CoM heterodisulfide reductase iron-sulfur subunit A family protein [Bacteroidales bacterium]
MEKPRIGVYVCACGTNIAKIVDVAAVAEEMKSITNVIISKDYKYMCSDPGQDMIIKDIKENNLNRIVVASCSPRIHELTFRKAIQKAGLNPYLLQIANIREHVSWVHTDKEVGTKKAMALIKAAINRVNLHQPLDARSVKIDPATLIIGGGISGITAALDIARAGKKVYLVEKTDKLGGHTAEIDLTFPYLNSAQQMIKPLIEEVTNSENIELFLNTEIKSISGYIGNFETTLPENGAEKKVTFGNIFVAVGLKTFDPSRLENYGYSKFPDVIISAEFEKMLLSGEIKKKDGNIPKDIAIIHCVGSRNKNSHEYCSRICCTVALKYANQIRSAFPKANIYEIYTDMRAMSKGCEELYTLTSRKKVMFLMFDQENDLPKIRKADKNDTCDMIIEMNEKKSGKQIEVPADMVILMVGMEARESAKQVSNALGVSLDMNNFFIEKHPKLDPVATTTNGVFIVGSCQGP